MPFYFGMTDDEPEKKAKPTMNSHAQSENKQNRNESDADRLYYITSEDVTMLHADVIILNGNHNSIFNYVVSATGKENEIKNYLKSCAYQCKLNAEDGDFCVTSGYDLGYKHIVYIFPPLGRTSNDTNRRKNFQLSLRKLIFSAFSYVTKELKAQSIVFCSLSFANLKEEWISKTINAAINTWIRTETPYLKVAIAVSPHMNSYEFNNTFEPHTKIDRSIFSDYKNKMLKEQNEFNGDINDYFISIRKEYMLRHTGTVEMFAEKIGCNKSTISRYRSGGKAQNKELALTVGLALALNPEEMFRWVTVMGYKYPDDERDYYIDELLRSDTNDFEEIVQIVNKQYTQNKLAVDRSAANIKNTKDKCY